MSMRTAREFLTVSRHPDKGKIALCRTQPLSSIGPGFFSQEAGHSELSIEINSSQEMSVGDFPELWQPRTSLFGTAVKRATGHHESCRRERPG
jgi:hypothetical protein